MKAIFTILVSLSLMQHAFATENVGDDGKVVTLYGLASAPTPATQDDEVPTTLSVPLHTLSEVVALPMGAIVQKCIDHSRLVVSVGSYHYHTRGRHLNSQNYGLGLECDVAKDWSASVVVYNSSHDRTVTALMLHWTPLQYGKVHLGLVGALAHGYGWEKGSRIPNDDLRVGLTFLAKYKERGWGVNLHVAPPPSRKASGFIGVMVTYDFAQRPN